MGACLPSASTYPTETCIEVGVRDVANTQSAKVRTTSVVISPRHLKARLVAGCEVPFGEVMVSG